MICDVSGRRIEARRQAVKRAKAWECIQGASLPGLQRFFSGPQPGPTLVRAGVWTLPVLVPDHWLYRSLAVVWRARRGNAPAPNPLQGRTGCPTGEANAFEGQCPIPPTPFPAACAAGKGAFSLVRGCPRAASPPADTPFFLDPRPRRGGGGVRGGGTF